MFVRMILPAILLVPDAVVCSGSVVAVIGSP
jgi:hypothetical protein